MIMYVNAVRLNASVGSVVVDSAIAIVNDTNRSDIISFYSSLERSREELILWKNMILVLSERCRRGWTNDKECEYMAFGNILHCHCSLGKGHQGTDVEYHYSNNAVFPNFIRITPSPLFPVEELGTVTNPTTSLAASTTSSSSSSSSSVSEIRPASPSTNITSSLSTIQNIHSSCGHCKKSDGTLSKCGKCKQISYCGRECQVAHWKIHKKIAPSEVEEEE
eukprot:gene10011-20834_t